MFLALSIFRNCNKGTIYIYLPAVMQTGQASVELKLAPAVE
jgi:hypothetical protein